MDEITTAAFRDEMVKVAFLGKVMKALRGLGRAKPSAPVRPSVPPEVAKYRAAQKAQVEATRQKHLMDKMKGIGPHTRKELQRSGY